MQIQSNKLILGLLVIFLSSCVPLSGQTFPSSDLNKGALLEINQGSLLIDSETFIADSKEQVKNSAQTGPVLDAEAASYTITKTTNRRQIDKEEKENILVLSWRRKIEFCLLLKEEKLFFSLNKPCACKFKAHTTIKKKRR